MIFVKTQPKGLRRIPKANTNHLRRIILFLRINLKKNITTISKETGIRFEIVQDALIFLKRYGLIKEVRLDRIFLYKLGKK
ncbi:MAG: hypothetical protein AABY22_07680 [Nanoarchaeota archaeon]